MYEKVNPYHPDKVADRIAGAVVDVCYKLEKDPKVAVEVLIGHGHCTTIVETSAPLTEEDVREAIFRINGECYTNIIIVPQDKHLANNQDGKVRCGDNGIFKGVPTTKEQKELARIAKEVTAICPHDGKYIINGKNVTICQSNLTANREVEILPAIIGYNALINPIGEWTGGTNVDSGATNRKLGSDMGDAVTGGGLHGKDLSKADVSLNIFAHILAQQYGMPVEISCSIGDEYVCGQPYSVIVDRAKDYIGKIGGFEKFAEWGLI